LAVQLLMRRYCGHPQSPMCWTKVLVNMIYLNAKGVIVRALDQFRVKSCIDFKVHDSETYYLKIQKLTGYFLNGQDLSIGAGCDWISIAEHEILHALGFYHEQSRYDRDDYVQIIWSNILSGQQHNFDKVSSSVSTAHGTPYDYWSVMHYGKDAFTNGNGSTVITIDPKYQDVIGQNLEMSSLDVKELNLLYHCNSTVAFMLYCGFSNGTTCQMNQCSQGGNPWKVVTQVTAGPSSDHTTLPTGNQETGYFMHASTASGQQGDSARLETKVMSPKRGCNVQCLQFYYFNSGNESDALNIWIREFQNDKDSTGILRLVGQVQGNTSYWKLHVVSLNATTKFQVVFEVRKGAGSSKGGFSIDDINLSETECPHVILQIDNLVNRLNTDASGTRIYSPRQYSKNGYAYRVAAILYKTFVGMYVQLLSGVNDNQLQWPCLKRQMNFQLLDQTPNKQEQMTKQSNFVSTNVWSNPRETGVGVFYDNGELVYGKPLWGYSYFAQINDLQTREVLKGGSAIFMFNFEGELQLSSMQDTQNTSYTQNKTNTVLRIS
uniref:Metalloendopeptidase n=1 Tax=Nothobranchius furzeri TaxID=105023 RepID=A0A8C6KBE5_NOTFU